ncbi:MAG: threonine synthase [Pseudomonadota bacterium]
MHYVSTRGRASAVGFADALLTGLAPDGGLYVPESWPDLEAICAETRETPYADIAARIIGAFAGDAFDADELRELAQEAYAGFAEPEAAPLTRFGDEDWILELYHGPTLAFKDFAMQLLGRLFDRLLERRGQGLTIIAATSGDTGAAAIHAFAGSSRVKIVVLHPKGRVTDVQRRMMTTVSDDNVLNLAVNGSFDDCQRIVKALFADEAFTRKTRLSGVNSINWARLAAQTVYYVTALQGLGPGAPVNFVAPTGNFGDIFAGYVAKRAGAPIARLGVAVNANDILHRVMTSGVYAPASVAKTLSPSMDIQVASNFERLLFDASGRDPSVVRGLMAALGDEGAMTLSPQMRKTIAGDFVSCAVDDEATVSEMRAHYEETGALIDPHTAVGRVAAKRLRAKGAVGGRVVTLSTAHPAKFPDAVRRATGEEAALPPAWRDLYNREERMAAAPAEAGAVKRAILDHA